MHAEQAYLFRHALLRDAAYQLQLPGDRARLHALAFDIIEALHGGTPPAPPAFEGASSENLALLPIDAHALELAAHAAQACLRPGAPQKRLAQLRALYLRRGAEFHSHRFHPDTEAQAWRELAALVPPSARGEALLRAGLALYRAGRLREALALFEEIVAPGHAAGPGMVARARANIGNILLDHGRAQEAEAAFVAALADMQAPSDEDQRQAVLMNLASLQYETGRFAQAEQIMLGALEGCRKSGNLKMEGAVLGNLALCQRQAARNDLAERTLNEAIAIHRRTGSLRNEGLDLGKLANLLLARGQPQAALEAHARALEIHREVGNRAGQAIALGDAAYVYSEMGRMAEADATFQSALALDREVGHRRAEGLHLCDHALVKLALGEHAQAAAAWREGAAIIAQVGDAPSLDFARKAMREACAKAGVPPFDQDAMPGA